MTMQPMTYKLGRRPPHFDTRTLRLENYLRILPKPPVALDYSGHVQDWGMYGNDQYGDCTEAAIAHMQMLWAALNGASDVPDEQTVISAYKDLTGCQSPGDAHDTGLEEIQVLRQWKTDFVAFCSINVQDIEFVKQALCIFQGVYIGFVIPDPAQLFAEFNAQTPWTPEEGQAEEGHAVCITGYDASTLTCVSWGRTQQMTWDFWRSQVDEAWAVLSLDEGKVPPKGFDLAQLKTDLAAIGQVES